MRVALRNEGATRAGAGMRLATRRLDERRRERTRNKKQPLRACKEGQETSVRGGDGAAFAVGGYGHMHRWVSASRFCVWFCAHRHAKHEREKQKEQEEEDGERSRVWKRAGNAKLSSALSGRDGRRWRGRGDVAEPPRAAWCGATSLSFNAVGHAHTRTRMHARASDCATPSPIASAITRALFWCRCRDSARRHFPSTGAALLLAALPSLVSRDAAATTGGYVEVRV